MHSAKKIGKWLLHILGVFALIMLILFTYVAYVSQTDPPVISDSTSISWQREDHGEGFYTIGNNWFRKSNSGLFELYVEGSPFERGVANGRLSKELIVSQEDYFSDQIRKMIPSSIYLHFLKYMIGWFNRNLSHYVTKEYQEEIYGVSQSASGAYGYIGTNYERILNYHAAHDIGHALQNMALVGCTSFGTWGAASEDSAMIIGRNFDFFVSDDFAKNKIILFENPSQGFRFMSVTWGGFIGVVSGMNEKGLTVTINAAKSSVPMGSATPVSLVAREILQYASNIKEAVAIAHRRTMFVSESFLIASAADHKAVIIEKTPDTLDIYDPKEDHILCANHFQSKILVGSESNILQMKESASAYRYRRLQELLKKNGRNTVQKTVRILRDQKGLQDKDIGMGNEKALNQLIAHHSIVFEPQKLLVWVSTAPWQLGEYVGYDLRKIFAMQSLMENREVYDATLTIPPDSFLLTPKFKALEQYQKFKQQILNGEEVNTDDLVQSNPEYYQSYVLAGDYSLKHNEKQRALHYYQVALTKEIATEWESAFVRNKINDIQNSILGK